jgi:membrane-associated protein
VEPLLALVETLLEWLEPAFREWYGYALIGVAVYLERIVLLGYFIPGETIMILGAVMATQGVMSLAGVIVVAGAASLAGESTSFLLGGRYGGRLVRRLPFRERLEARVEESKELFDRHGGKAIAIGRFAAGGGSTVPFVAGTAEMAYRRFLAFNAPAVVVWAVVFGTLGYLLGENLELVDDLLTRYGWFALLLLGGLVAAYVMWRRRRKRRQETA